MTIATFTSPAVMEIQEQAITTTLYSIETPEEREQSQGINLDNLDDLDDLNREAKPGLHGRARIWGPNRTLRMILLTTALMGYVRWKRSSFIAAE